MGCLSLQFLKACTTGSNKIKVMTVDGRCLKYATPSIVKEVLMDYPLHMLFDSQTVRVLGDRARPLQSSFSLQPGHVYFLVPQAAAAAAPSSHGECATGNLRTSSTSDCACTELSCSNCMTTSSNPALLKSDLPLTPQVQSDASSQSELAHISKPTKCSMPGKRKVSFAAAPTNAASKLQTTKACVQFLPSPSDGVVRIKMVVSKRQLASVLKGGGDCVSMVEGLLSPLLEASGSDTALSACNDISSNQSWRPSLESIPESLLPSQRSKKDAN